MLGVCFFCSGLNASVFISIAFPLLSYNLSDHTFTTVVALASSKTDANSCDALKSASASRIDSSSSKTRRWMTLGRIKVGETEWEREREEKKIKTWAGLDIMYSRHISATRSEYSCIFFRCSPSIFNSNDLHTRGTHRVWAVFCIKLRDYVFTFSRRVVGRSGGRIAFKQRRFVLDAVSARRQDRPYGNTIILFEKIWMMRFECEDGNREKHHFTGNRRESVDKGNSL